MKNRVQKTCTICETVFHPLVSEVNRGGGKFCSRKCVGAYQSIIKKGPGNPKWRGDNVLYRALHQWIERELGTPDLCEHCGVTDGIFQWSNKSGEYKRDLSDWQRLCIKCHNKFDDIARKGWITRKKGLTTGL